MPVPPPVTIATRPSSENIPSSIRPPDLARHGSIALYGSILPGRRVHVLRRMGILAPLPSDDHAPGACALGPELQRSLVRAASEAVTKGAPRWHCRTS